MIASALFKNYGGPFRGARGRGGGGKGGQRRETKLPGEDLASVEETYRARYSQWYISANFEIGYYRSISTNDELRFRSADQLRFYASLFRAQ